MDGLWQALLRFIVPGFVQLGATLGGQPPPAVEHEDNGTAWRYRPAVPLSVDESLRWTELVGRW